MIKVVKSDNIIGGNSTMNSDFSELNIELTGNKVPVLGDSGKNVVNWTGTAGSQNDSMPISKPIEAFLDTNPNLIQNGDFSLGKYYWNLQKLATVGEFEGRLSARLYFAPRETSRWMLAQALLKDSIYKQGQTYTVSASVYINSKSKIPADAFSIELRNIYGGVNANIVAINMAGKPTDTWLRVEGTGTATQAGSDSLSLLIGAYTADVYVTDVKVEYGDKPTPYQGHPLDYIPAVNHFNPESFVEEAVLEYAEENRYAQVITLEPNTKYVIATNFVTGDGTYADVFATLGSEAISTANNGVLTHGRSFRVRTTGNDGKLKISYRNGSLDKIKSGEHKIWINKNPLPSVFQSYGQEAAEVSSYYVRTTAGTSTTKLQVNIPSEANKAYTSSLKVLNMGINPITVGATAEEVVPVKPTSYSDWYYEYSNSSPATVGILLGVENTAHEITAIVADPEIIMSESSPNLVPFNRRKFEGWNIGTGSQTTTYKVPMMVLDNTWQTNLLSGTKNWDGAWNNKTNWVEDGEYLGLKVLKRENIQWGGVQKSVMGVVGKTYTFSCYVKTTSDADAIVYAVIYKQGATVNTQSKVIGAKEEWTRVSLTFTVTTGGNLNPRIENRVATGTIWICGYSLYEHPTDTTYRESPIDLHNPSNPVTYNPSSDQYLLLEKAPLEALDEGYSRNLIPNGTRANVSSNNAGLYPITTTVMYDKGKEFRRVTKIPSANTPFSVYNNLIPSIPTTGKKVTVSFKARSNYTASWILMARAYKDGGASINLPQDLSTLGISTEWRQFHYVLETPQDFQVAGYRLLPYTPVSYDGIDPNLLQLDLTDFKVEIGENNSPEYTQAWEDLPNAQKPATRIRTKGGTSTVKYYDNTGYGNAPNGTYSHKVVVKNNYSKDMYLRLEAELGLHTVAPNEVSSINMLYEKTAQFMIGWRMVTNGINDELDIIAYNPEIKKVSDNEVLTTANKDLTTWSLSEAAQTHIIPAPLHALYDEYSRNLYYESGKSYNITETHGTTQVAKYGRWSRKALTNTIAFLSLNHLVVGKTYTFFVDVCADQEATWAGRAMYINTNTSTTHTGGTNIPTTWQTIKGTFTYRAGDGLFHLYPNAIPTTGVYFSNFAIYEGTRETRPPYRKSWEDMAIEDRPAKCNPHSGQVTLIERAPLEAYNNGYSRNLVKYGKGDSLQGLSVSADLDTSKTEVITTESVPFFRLSHTALGYSRVISWNTTNRALQPLISGKTYTLSFWARRNTTQTGTTNPYTGMEVSGHYDDGTSVTKYFGINSFAIPNDNVWAKITRTFTFTGDRSKDYLYLALNYVFRDVVGYMDIKELKLEEGSTSTPFNKAWEEMTDAEKPAFRVKTNNPVTRTAVYTVVNGLQKGGVYIPSATIKNIGTNKAYMQFAGQRTLSLTAGEMKDVSFITTATGTGHWLSILNEVATHDIDLLVSNVSMTRPDNVIVFPIDLPAENRTLIMENISFTGTGPIHIVAGVHGHTFDNPTAFKQAHISNAAIPNLTIAFSDDVSGYIGAIKLFKGFDVEEVVNIPVQYLKETRRTNLEGWYVEGEFDIEDSENLQQDYILMVPTKTKKLQPFRIHNKEIDNDVVKIYARHVVYDLANYIVPAQTFTDLLPVTITDKMTKTMLPDKSPFRFDVTAGTPVTVQSQNNTALEVLAELLRAGGYKIDPDGFKVRISGNLGKTTDIPLMYGSNLEGVRILENFDNVVTTMYPVLKDGYMGPEVKSEVQYGKKYVRTQEIDLQIPEEHQDDITWINEQLVLEAKKKLKVLQLPSISYVVTSSVPQELEIYDTVRVYHPAITSVYGNTKKEALFFPVVVAAYEYNVISEMVESLQYGTEIYNTYSLLAGETQQLVDVLEEKTGLQIDTMQQMIDRQTVYINDKNKNGYIIIEDNEILAVDRLPKEEAVNVMKIGVGGIGMSSTGITGEFKSAWSLEHGFNADFIRTGTLEADRIAAGSITADHLSASIGRDLNLSSNTSINFLVGNAVSPLQDVVNAQEQTLQGINNQLGDMKTEIKAAGNTEALNNRIKLVETGFKGHDSAIAVLNQYKRDTERAMKAITINDEGLNIYDVDANGDPLEYRVVISDKALEFKKGGTVVAYVSGETLYIGHAIIRNSIVLGSHHVESGSITEGRTIWRQAVLEQTGE